MKNLKTTGESDYDYKHDILFLKSKNREYKKSVEMDNITVDIDQEGFVVGIQIFEASKFLNLKKEILMKIPRWEYKAMLSEGKIEIRLLFKIKSRNKIIEKNPIIKQVITESLPDSESVCIVG
ncbi:MAG: DUF2283 domain-containing protein [Candidatus Woesearchaeota archaeon]